MPDDGSRLHFEVDGRAVSVADEGVSLLEVLRDRLGMRSIKDGCSPQGQCGCCTVLVDGQPRVACVTPARRVAGRSITTIDGLSDEERSLWADAFLATGASQCGFCTPGIIVRLSTRPKDPQQALLAHMCRCTGWRSILEAADMVGGSVPTAAGRRDQMAAGRRDQMAAGRRDQMAAGRRDLVAAEQRAAIEGHGPQRVHADVALGAGGFADDTAPADALVAVPDGRGGWAIGETLTEARAHAGKVQGRRTTVASRPPLAQPAGEWALLLRTSWVEPAYLETDASWCLPGGEPASPLANGGAFGGKTASPVAAAARELADQHGRAVRVLLSREDSVVLGPKRPPMAIGVDSAGRGVARMVRCPAAADAVRAFAPSLTVEEIDLPGPIVSGALRAAGVAEAAVVLAGLRGHANDIQLPRTGVAERDVRRPSNPCAGGLRRAARRDCIAILLSWRGAHGL